MTVLWAREEQGMDQSAGVEDTPVLASVSGRARNFWCAKLSVLRLFMLVKTILDYLLIQMQPGLLA